MARIPKTRPTPPILNDDVMHIRHNVAEEADGRVRVDWYLVTSKLTKPLFSTWGDDYSTAFREGKREFDAAAEILNVPMVNAEWYRVHSRMTGR